MKLSNLAGWQITEQNIRRVYSVRDKGMNELLCIQHVAIRFTSQNISQVIIGLNNKHVSVQKMYWSQKTLCNVKQHLGIKSISIRKTPNPILSNILDALEVLRKPNYKFYPNEEKKVHLYLKKNNLSLK